MSDAAFHRRIKDAFDHVLELEPDARADWLRALGDDAVRQEVEALVEVVHESREMFERPLVTISEPSLAAPAEGSSFGNYRLVREIGRGGMGTVFLAERRDGEFDQRVAVKVIRGSFAGSETERRFREERRILAALQHPNVASLIDGGVSAGGEPFLAMEYVDGISITDFCEQRKLNVRERLRLFLKVCRAVAFAHRSLVVHRDIKPSNILVRDDGEPKLLDFGLAKLVGIDDTPAAQTVYRALTPAYASPEQLLGRPMTTSTDIYSLGVCLYELLAGRRPIETDGLSFEEMMKAVGATVPTAPGLVGKGSGERRRTDQDLDNVVMTALRKEPERRYASVEAFAKDIENYLDGKPVSARPNTLWYRTGKLVARNKPAVAIAVLLAISLVGGLVVAIRQTRIAQAAQARAEAQSAKAGKIANFMEKVLDFANPLSPNEGGKQQGDVRLIDVIAQLSDRIETEFPDDPDIQAELHQKFAEIFHAKNFNAESHAHAERAVEIGRVIYGPKHPALAKYVYYLAMAKFRGHEAYEGFRLAEASIQMFRATDPSDVNLAYLLEDYGNLGVEYRYDLDLARAYLLDSREMFRRREGDNGEGVARTTCSLSRVALLLGDVDGAARLLEEGKARFAARGEPGNLLKVFETIAIVDRARGRENEVATMIENAEAEFLSKPATENRLLLNAIDWIIVHHKRQKEYAAALRLATVREERLLREGVSDGNLFFIRLQMAICFARLGKLAAARIKFDLAMRFYESIPQPERRNQNFLLGEYNVAIGNLELGARQLTESIEQNRPLRPMIQEDRDVELLLDEIARRTR